jgi:hypothetical protein
VDIDKRLTLLEQQRPDGVWTLETMNDAQLIQIITGGQATDITDKQLERIAKGETWEALKSD